MCYYPIYFNCLLIMSLSSSNCFKYLTAAACTTALDLLFANLLALERDFERRERDEALRDLFLFIFIHSQYNKKICLKFSLLITLYMQSIIECLFNVFNCCTFTPIHQEEVTPINEKKPVVPNITQASYYETLQAIYDRGDSFTIYHAEFAAKHGFSECLQYLIRKGCPLPWYIIHHDLECMKILYKAGCRHWDPYTIF